MLYKSRRWVENEVRVLAIYLLRHVRGERLERIGEEFNLSHYNAVEYVINNLCERTVFMTE